jgi:hypothetical protein
MRALARLLFLAAALIGSGPVFAQTFNPVWAPPWAPAWTAVFGKAAITGDPIGTAYNFVSGSSWTPNFTGTVSAECIGGSQGGSYPTRGSDGGAYAKQINIAVVANTPVSYSVGVGQSSWFKSTTTVLAQVGLAYPNSGNPQTSSSVGVVLYAGGPGEGDSANYGGGGGAAGPHGRGGQGFQNYNGGGAGCQGAPGGVGDAGYGGAGGGPCSGSASNGTEWGAYGSGGGIGAYNTASPGGGNYGGGYGTSGMCHVVRTS